MREDRRADGPERIVVKLGPGLLAEAATHF
jgi:hypothetical protein